MCGSDSETERDLSERKCEKGVKNIWGFLGLLGV